MAARCTAPAMRASADARQAGAARAASIACHRHPRSALQTAPAAVFASAAPVNALRALLVSRARCALPAPTAAPSMASAARGVACAPLAGMDPTAPRPSCRSAAPRTAQGTACANGESAPATQASQAPTARCRLGPRRAPPIAPAAASVKGGFARACQAMGGAIARRSPRAPLTATAMACAPMATASAPLVTEVPRGTVRCAWTPPRRRALTIAEAVASVATASAHA
mmetsp:Transcript_42379/g.111543  ORF Transcript_42379/g.111543 Transcript_42379/m.111543 type:complete len:227 (+) Transcript_42379:2899-3579(+)